MASIFRSWGNSIKLLQPNSLREWGLLTLKGSKDAYFLLATHFWWLFLILGAWFSYYDQVSKRPAIWHLVYGQRVKLMFLVLCVLSFLWCICCVLTARPSRRQKDSFNFYRDYWPHVVVAQGLIFLYITFFSFFILLTWICAYYIPKFLLIFFATSLGVSLLIDFLFLMPSLYTLFFLFDSQLSFLHVIKSIRQGVTLIIRTFPLLLLLSVLTFSVYRCMQFLLGDYWIAAALVLFPLYVQIHLYVYLKQKYECS